MDLEGFDFIIIIIIICLDFFSDKMFFSFMIEELSFNK